MGSASVWNHLHVLCMVVVRWPGLTVMCDRGEGGGGGGGADQEGPTRDALAYAPANVRCKVSS